MAAGKILRKLVKNADAGDVNLPKGRDLEKTFKSKTATVPNTAGQGRVRKPRSQILIENYRSNPNGVRTQFLNLPEDVKTNILQEIAEDFPPARPGEPLSGAGMELYQFLTEGDGIADSPTRRQVLMDDNAAGMRPGPMESRGDSFVKREYSEGPLGPTGDEVADQGVTFGDNPEPTGIVDNSPPDNPQNRYRKARNDAAELGYTKGGLSKQESLRGPERFPDIEDGQPINRAIPGTGRLSDAAATEVSPNGEKFARDQIKQGSKTSNQASDGVAAMDNSSYDTSFQEAIVGLMNNSRNPDALAGNRIDQLWNMISKTGDDPRTLFGSPEAMVDVMMGYVSPKMVDNMTNPSPIGQQLPASQRSKMSFELIREQLLKQADQLYTNADGSNGFGAATPDDLSRPSPILEPDGVNNPDADLDSVSSIGDLGDIPNRQRLNFVDDPETYLRQNGYTNEDIARIEEGAFDTGMERREALTEEALHVDGEIPDEGPTDFRDLYDPVGPREEPSGAPPGSAKDRMMSAETNQQDRFDLFQERMTELIEEGLSPDEAMEVMEGEGLGRDFLEAGPDQVAGVERFGIPRTPGTNPLGKQVQSNKKKGPLPPAPASVRAAKEKAIGAKGPQKTAEQAPTLNKDQASDGEVGSTFTEEELQRISRGEAYVDGNKVINGKPGDKTGDPAPTFTEEELQRISRGEAHVDGGEVKNGKPGDGTGGRNPPGNMGLDEAESILKANGYDSTYIASLKSLGGDGAVLWRAYRIDGPSGNKVNTGDLSSSGGGEQLDNLDGAATELPEETFNFDTDAEGRPLPRTDTTGFNFDAIDKTEGFNFDTDAKGNPVNKTDTTGFNFDADAKGKAVNETDTGGFNFETDKNGKPIDPNKENTPEGTVKTEEDTPGFLGKGSTSRKVAGWTGTAAVPIGLGALALSGTKSVNVPPEDSMAPTGDESAPSEVPVGMSPDGGFERDADGSLSAAGLHAFLEKGRRHRASRPSINTGTQTMGNWIR